MLGTQKTYTHRKGTEKRESESEKGTKEEGKETGLILSRNDNKLTSVASQLNTSDRVKSKWTDWITDRVQWRLAGVALALGFSATSMWAIGAFEEEKKIKTNQKNPKTNHEMLAGVFLNLQCCEFESSPHCCDSPARNTREYLMQTSNPLYSCFSHRILIFLISDQQGNCKRLKSVSKLIVKLCFFLYLCQAI